MNPTFGAMDPEGFVEAMENMDPMSMGILMSRVFVGIMVAVVLLTLLQVVLQIMYSVGLYTVAHRRGIKHPWMAFVPVLEPWILGSIADQYQYVVWGQIRNRRKVNLGLTIAAVALVGVFYALYFVLIAKAMQMGFADVYGAQIEVENMLLSILPWFLIIAVALLILSVVQIVYRYICWYNVFESCRPKLSVLFIILGILSMPLLQLFIFICRNKDNGMPPRKAEVQPEQIPAEAPAPEAQPAQTEEPALEPVEAVSAAEPAAEEQPQAE